MANVDDRHSEQSGSESTYPSTRLLVATDPAPVHVQNSGAESPFLLVCDHAGREIPSRLGRLGLTPAEMERHIAYDIGAAALAEQLAARLGACLIRQTYSRLVIDCNRDPARADAIVTLADGAVVSGNLELDAIARQSRIDAVHTPYHQTIAAELDARATAGVPTSLVLIHSFTPAMNGFTRPWQVGVLHQGNALSLAALELLSAEPGLTVGDNEPYAMDNVDYTAPIHAQARGLEYLELETRQDLIAERSGQAWFADLYARLLPEALRRLETRSR
ncbi:MAG: N-formylglutamate amidohydrolase [Caulobacteraceae bacterium]